MYSFFYVDKNNERYTFYGLTQRTAKQMYNIFNREMAIFGYLKVGWNKES